MSGFPGTAVVLGLWGAWITYWYAASAGAKPNRLAEDRASRLSHAVPLAVAVLLLWLPSTRIGWLDQRFVPASAPTFWTGVAVLAAGLAFAVWARVHLGTNWSGFVTIKRGHELIRTGPYRFVRHPIYTGLLVAFAGSAIVRGEWRAILAVTFAFAALWRKVGIEERWLTAVFGPEYEAYRHEVPALLPFLV